MDKKRLIGIVLSILLVGVVCLKFYLDKKDTPKNSPVATESAKKFKSEYESLNGKQTSNNKDYLKVNIEEINPIIYKTDKEIIDILKNGTGIIYFGFNSCPWCRSMIESLIKSANENEVDKIYYVDVKDIRSKFTIENKKLKEEKGSDAYYEILDILKDHLEDYYFDGKFTKQKRLYAPTVVAIKSGKVVGFHEGTVDSQQDPYKGLNETEKKEISKIFNQMMRDIKDSTCDNAC